MAACPGFEQLERLLREELPPGARAGVAAHLDVCPLCRRTFRALSTDQPLETVPPDRRPDGRDGTTLVGPPPAEPLPPSTVRDERNGSGSGTETLDDPDLHGPCPPGDPTEWADPAQPPPQPFPETLAAPDGRGDGRGQAGTTEPAPAAGSPDGPEFAPETLPRTDPATGGETLMPDPSAAARGGPGRVAGYEIVSELGRGGMGVVYKAKQTALNRLVALKMIRGGDSDPDQVARFRIEAEAVAQLRHANVVQIYDVGASFGAPFVSFELLEGGSLADRLGGTPQAGPAAAGLMVTLASAMEVAHKAGIVHRDLKPSNILFTAEGEPKIADFGLAKRLESKDGQTVTGQVMGTPSYMAPEQARGRTHEITPATDVYALGAILYELLTGRPPFKGPTVMETVRQVAEDDPVPPSRLQPRVSRDLETVCLKCLAKEPARRYARAQDLADDLRRHLDGVPVLARRTPPWERALKWARRHPTAATVMALATTALVAGTAGGLRYRAVVAGRERDEARKVAQDRAKEERSLFDAQGLLAREQWSDAQKMLSNVLTRLDKQPRLKDVRDRAASLLDQADRGGDRQKGREADRGRFREFGRLHDEALFHETQFTGLDLPGNLDLTRRSTRDALAVFAPPAGPDVGTLGPLPESLSDGERSAVRDGCYVLLLVLAESEARPEDGLKALDRAARLNPTPTRAYHLRRAACLARSGDRDGAGRELLKAEALAPATAFDQFLAGQERYKRGDWRAALRHFDAALRLQPDNFWAHALSAISSLQMKRPVEAKAELNACLQREPGFAWLYVLRGFASAQIASMAGAVADRVGPEGGSLRLDVDGQRAAAEADYLKAMELLRGKPGDELNYVLRVNRGVLALQRGELAAAESDLKEAVRLNGRQYQAFVGLADVFTRQGRPDEAIEQYGRAIALRPDWAPLYRGRAQVTFNRADATPAQRKAALRDLDQAVRLDAPGDPVLAFDHTLVARLLRRDGRDPEALAACEAALAAVPDYQDAHLLRIEVLMAMRRYDDVTRSCDAVLARGKPSAELHALRGLARSSLRDYPGAIEDDTQSLALRPGQPGVLRHRGWAYSFSNAPELALRDFAESIRLDPSVGDAYNGRGSALVRLGRHREAVADAEEAVRRGGSAQVAYNAARIYAQASSSAASEVERTGRDAVVMASRYQDRAVALLTAAVARKPAADRPSFWRDQVLTDPALRPLRQRLKHLDHSPPYVSAPKPAP